MAQPRKTKQGAPKLASLIDKDVLAAMAKSKAEAHKMGVNTYFDGVACLLGHVATRARSSGRCNECNDISRKKLMTSSLSTRGSVPKTFYIPFLGQSIQILSDNMN